MGLVEILILMLIAGVCGAIGEMIGGYSPGGCFASIGIGFIGALIGVFLADLLDLAPIFEVDVDGHTFPVVWSILGSAIFVAILGMLRGRRRPHDLDVTHRRDEPPYYRH